MLFLLQLLSLWFQLNHALTSTFETNSIFYIIIDNSLYGSPFAMIKLISHYTRCTEKHGMILLLHKRIMRIKANLESGFHRIWKKIIDDIIDILIEIWKSCIVALWIYRSHQRALISYASFLQIIESIYRESSAQYFHVSYHLKDFT